MSCSIGSIQVGPRSRASNTASVIKPVPGVGFFPILSRRWLGRPVHCEDYDGTDKRKQPYSGQLSDFLTTFGEVVANHEA
jgi:hypothetical protein